LLPNPQFSQGSSVDVCGVSGEALVGRQVFAKKSMSAMEIYLQLTRMLHGRRSNHEYRYVHRTARTCVIVFATRL
jgi:hypothetical protein